MSDPQQPHRRQPTRLPRPWDSPGNNTGVGCHFLLQCMKSEKWKWSHSVMPDPQRPHGLQPTRLLRPRDFPGKSTGVGCHCLSWLTGKDPDAGKDWRQEEKETTEDEMLGWHHRLDGHEFGWTPGVGDGQGGLVCCDSWDRKESDTTEQLALSLSHYVHYLLSIH